MDQDNIHSRNIERAARLIDGAEIMVFVTGAGMGVDSGLPDFRGTDGFWTAYPALGRQRIEFSSIARPSAFREQPRLAWGFYGHRMLLYRQTKPHVGFDLLRKWGEGSLCGYRVFTSNVDGHFQKAGFEENLIAECHGSLNYLQCLEACTNEVWSADEFIPEIDDANCLLLNEPPHCPRCGAIARPNIYMFNDEDWIENRTQHQMKQLNHWTHDASRLLVVEVGAGTAIATAREFTHRIAFDVQARIIRINPQDSAIFGNPAHVGLAMNALPALQSIDAALQSY